MIAFFLYYKTENLKIFSSKQFWDLKDRGYVLASPITMPGIAKAQQIFVEWVIGTYWYNMFPCYLGHLWGNVTKWIEQGGKRRVHQANFWFCFLHFPFHFEMDLNDAYVDVLMLFMILYSLFYKRAFSYSAFVVVHFCFKTLDLAAFSVQNSQT